MTFYEAALRVLEREGKPLHIDAITAIALKENLLSHVGKSPEDVMQSRLLAMARRRNDRKVVATAPKTYGLVEWGIPEDPAALALVPETPNEDEKPLRPRERHPIPSPDKVRVSGRGERPRKGHRDEEGRRRRKYPPLSEVAFEVLSQASGPMSGVDLAAAARERDLVSEDLGAEALLNALREDNRRRTEAGRRPAFGFTPAGEVFVDRGAPEAVEAEAPVAAHAEAGRQERGPGASRLYSQAVEHRRQIFRLVRRRLGDMDAFAFERAALALLEALSFREVKVVKRGKDGPLLMARRKDGLSDMRWVVQVLKGGPEIARDDVEDLRKDAGHFGAQLAMLLSPADVTREGRHAAQAAGGAPIFLWCGDALPEKCAEVKLGVTLQQIELWDLDEEFYRRCREKGREDERSRRGREERPAQAAPQQQAPAQEPAEATAPTPAEAAAPSPETGEAESRRREEERLRAETHERIEAAELQARLKRAPSA